MTAFPHTTTHQTHHSHTSPDADANADNLDVAMQARELADAAPAGSLRQAAAGSVAVACATARDIAQARLSLEGVNPADVREAALELLDLLAAAR